MSTKNDKKRIKSIALRHKALELRTLGFSYSQIADHCACSKTAAFNAVNKSLQEVEHDNKRLAELNKTLDLQRLDWVIKEAMKQVVKGDLKAMDRVMRAMDRRARLLGLEAPQKIAATTPDGQDAATGVVVVPATMDLQEWLDTYQPKEDEDA